jgi:hypothetical protein
MRILASPYQSVRSSVRMLQLQNPLNWFLWNLILKEFSKNLSTSKIFGWNWRTNAEIFKSYVKLTTHYVKTYLSLCNLLDSNLFNIYRSEKCVRLKFWRKMKHTLYTQHIFYLSNDNFRDGLTKMNKTLHFFSHNLTAKEHHVPNITCSIIPRRPSEMAQPVTLLTYFREALDSNLGADIKYPEFFRGFLTPCRKILG